MQVNRRRSPEFLAIPMVAAAVVYGGLLYWALTDDTGLAWTIFVLANVAIVGLGLVLLFRHRASAGPVTRAASPADGVYRLLVILDGPGSAAELAEHVPTAAADRSAEAFVVAPTHSSWLDWVTGDQTVYDRASAELAATLTALTEAGIPARGRTATHDPVLAAADGLAEFPAEAILVVTSAKGADSAPDQDDLAEQLRKSTSLPVTQLTAAEPN